MKRLLVLTAVAMLTVSSVGCRQGFLSRLCPSWRSDECDPCMTADPCCGGGGEMYMNPPAVINGSPGGIPVTPGPVGG